MEAEVERNLARNYEINRSYLNQVEPSTSIILQLYPHQKEALGWLINRENCEDLPSLWERRRGVCINVMDLTVDVCSKLLDSIFFDSTGLGKTLYLISLICHDVGTDISGNINWKVGKECRKMTLVVCSSSVISDWILQMQKSTKKGSLNVYQYNKAETVDSFDEYNVVLATYKNISKPGCPLKRTGWWRVILDNADHFSNMREDEAKPFIQLRARRIWLVSGKPINNAEYKLMSFMRFLDIRPLASKSKWLKWLDIPGERTRKPRD